MTVEILIDNRKALETFMKAEKRRNEFSEKIKATGLTRLVLPLPPSVNSYWVNRVNKKTKKRGRMRGKRAVKYVAQAGYAIMTQGRPQFGESLVVVEMYLHHTPNGGDIDNYSKGVFDALTHWGVWEDDDQIIRLLTQVRGRVKKGCVIVDIRKATTDEIRWSREIMDDVNTKGWKKC